MRKIYDFYNNQQETRLCKILRNFNLHILVDEELEGECLSIFNELKETFSDLNPYQREGDIYYGTSEDDSILLYTKNHGSIFLIDDLIWKHYKNNFQLSNKQTKDIITWYFKKVYLNE